MASCLRLSTLFRYARLFAYPLRINCARALFVIVRADHQRIEGFAAKFCERGRLVSRAGKK